MRSSYIRHMKGYGSGKKWYNLYGRVEDGYTMLCLCLAFASLIFALVLSGCGKAKTFKDVAYEIADSSQGTFTCRMELTKSEGSDENTVMVKVDKKELDGYEDLSLEVYATYTNIVKFHFLSDSNSQYLDVETLRNSLLNCSDEELKSYGDLIPVSVSTISCDKAEFLFANIFSEDAEYEDMKFGGLANFEGRVELLAKMFIGIADSSCEYTSSGQKNVEYKMTSGDSFSSAMRSAVADLGTYYDKYVGNLEKLGLSTEYEVSNGFSDAKDNFLESFSDFIIDCQTGKVMFNSFNGEITGYSDDKYSEYKGTCTLDITSEESSYCSKIEFTYNSDVYDITAPTGECKDVSKFNESCFNLNDFAYYLFNKCNISTIDLSCNKLELSNSTLDVRLRNLLANYLTVDASSVSDYIKSNSSSQNVSSLLEVIDDVTSSVKVVVESEEEKPAENIKTAKGVLENGFEFEVSINEDLSTSELLAVNLRLLNTLDEKQTVKITKFSMQDDSNNKTSANNESRITDIDSNFDTDSLLKSVTLDSGEFTDTVLYFSRVEGKDSLTLYYYGSELGLLSVH